MKSNIEREAQSISAVNLNATFDTVHITESLNLCKQSEKMIKESLEIIARLTKRNQVQSQNNR